MNNKRFYYLEPLNQNEDPTLNSSGPRGTFSSPGGYNQMQEPNMNQAGTPPAGMTPQQIYQENRSGDPESMKMQPNLVSLAMNSPMMNDTTIKTVLLIGGAFLIYKLGKSSKNKQ